MLYFLKIFLKKAEYFSKEKSQMKGILFDIRQKNVDEMTSPDIEIIGKIENKQKLLSCKMKEVVKLKIQGLKIKYFCNIYQITRAANFLKGKIRINELIMDQSWRPGTCLNESNSL